MKTIVVRYGEIGLKGKNRIDFERKLVANIKRVVDKSVEVNRAHKQILLTLPETAVEATKKRLKTVFGIAWFAPVSQCENSLEKISETAVKLAKRLKKGKRTFAVRATRAIKQISFTSGDIERKVGDAIRKSTNLKVDLTNPDLTVHVAVDKEKSFVFADKIKGPGGLPVGSSGRVLSLLSGGFDSIVSSHQMAKRGAKVDFLHFHVFPQAKKVLETKMPKIWNQLANHTLSSKIFLASYIPFQMAVLDLERRGERYELVVFRRLMVKVGERLAEKLGYQALVLGDSLGQVASQTMENIVAVEEGVNIPIFRPLIGQDKLEVVNLVKLIGLEKEATTTYKDCCSIISTHPSTRANLTRVKQMERAIRLDEIVETIVEQLDEVVISG